MKRIKKLGVLCLALLVVLSSIGALPGGNTAQAASAAVPEFTGFVKGNAGASPYMGWSSYSMQCYENGQLWVSEEKIRQMSDAMHEKLQAHGYKYINIDAGWNGGTDEYGRPVPNEDRYPGGFKNLIDYVHNNGQKIGIYVIPGVSKEAIDGNLPIYGTDYHMQDIVARDENGQLMGIDYWGFTYKIDFTKDGALQYIQSVADLFHQWGIDFVKLDSVSPGSDLGNSKDARGNVWAWGYALSKYNIWLEISWAVEHAYADQWKQWANGWRVEHDVESYNSEIGMVQWANIARLFPKAELWWRDAGPGGWNDFDSLDVGNGSMDGLTRDERQTAATLWAVSCAQFFIGDDISRLDSYGLSLLTNDEVIAVNQGGHPAHPVSTAAEQQVWYSNNGDGTFNVAVYNLGTKAATVDVNWSDIGLNGIASVRDLWSHRELGSFSGGIKGIELDPHASRLFKVTAASGTSSANDDDSNAVYTGSWTRNGGEEVPADSQSINVKIIDTGASPIVGKTGTSVTLNDTDSSIAYVGNWGYSNNRSFNDYNKDVHYTDHAGDYFEYGFNGTGIDFITEMDKGQGDVDIYLDNSTTPQAISTYIDQSNVPRQTVYSVSGLTDGPHTLKAVNKSAGKYMLLDALKVYGNTFVTQDTFDYDGQNDVAVTPVYGPGSVTGIRNGSADLTANVDYTVTGSAIAISGSYLSRLQDGKNRLTFLFEGGSTQTVTVIVPAAAQPPEGAGSRYIMVNDNDPAIRYTGKWGGGGRNADWKDYMNDAHYGETENGKQPYLEYSFTGTGIAYYCELDPNQGYIKFYIDGKEAGRGYSGCTGSDKQPSAMIWQSGKLDQGTHTFMAVKDDGSSFMLFDALRIEVPSLVSPDAASFDKNPSEQSELHAFITGNLTYFKGISNGKSELIQGTDYTVSGTAVTISREYLAKQPVGDLKLAFNYNGDFRSDVHATTIDGDSFSYTFKGTGIKLVGPAGPKLGEFEVYVDGQLKQTVNANSSQRLINQPLFELAGLSDDYHTITGIKKSGEYMLVDQFVYTMGTPSTPPGDGTNPPSSGGGGPSVPPTGAETVKGSISGVTSTVTVTRTTQADGTKKDRIELIPDEIEKAVEELIKAGAGSLTITIPDTGNEVARTEVTITEEAAKLIADGKLELIINTAGAAVQIPAASLGGITGDIVFNIIPVKAPAARNEIAQRAGGTPAVIAAAGGNGVKVAGQPVSIETNLQNREVSLVLPVDAESAGASGLGVYIEHSDGTREYREGELTGFNGGKGLSFNVDRFSTFAVVKSEAATEHRAYISGYGNGLFKPENKVTRAEMASILAKALNLQEKADISKYTDVKAGFWGADAIAKVAGSGLMNGYKDGTFKPDQPITRAEMAAIAAALVKSTEAAGAGFKDISNNWAEAAILKVQAAGVMGGYTGGNFLPGNPLTRAEAVTVVNRVLGRGPLYGITEAVWKDVPDTHWAAGDINEASVDHSFEIREQGGEQLGE